MVESFGALWNIQRIWASKTDMKTLCLLLTPLLALVLCCHRCFAGQPDAADAGVIGVGEWSEPVRDGDGHTLRGRLVVCDDRPANASNHARVYLELEHGGSATAMEVYYDINIGNTALNLELRDGHDQPVPRTAVATRAPSLPTCWVTLPGDATVRLRADLYAYVLKSDGLQLLLGCGTWIIPSNAPANAAAEFYLAGTFTPPADHPSPLKYHVWQGTLKLPKVKIPPPKAVKAG